MEENLRARKSLGQNFLHDRKVIKKIVSAGLSNTGNILEIGAGTGNLTAEILSQKGKHQKLIALEIDTNLIQTLCDRFESEIKVGDIEIIHADIQNFDFDIMGDDYGIIANIPYYLSGGIIRKIFSQENLPVYVALILQREVAERIVEADGHGSILSNSVRAFGTPKIQFRIGSGAFVPAPSVDSALLTVSNISRDHFVDDVSDGEYFDLLHLAFRHKRKQLINNLSLLLSRQELMKVFAELDFRPDIRAEELSVGDWFNLLRKIQGYTMTNARRKEN